MFHLILMISLATFLISAISKGRGGIQKIDAVALLITYPLRLAPALKKRIWLPDTWHLTPDNWHLTSHTWHTLGGEHWREVEWSVVQVRPVQHTVDWKEREWSVLRPLASAMSMSMTSLNASSSSNSPSTLSLDLWTERAPMSHNIIPSLPPVGSSVCPYSYMKSPGVHRPPE